MNRTAAVLLGLMLLLIARGVAAHPGVDQALRHFDTLIEASPRDQALYLQRGNIYSNDGQFEKAKADFTRAAQLGDPVLVSFEFGVVHYRMRDFPAARRYFDTFLQRFPDHSQCLEYRARLLRDAGDTDAAIADFERALALQPQPNPGDYISLATLLGSRGEKGIAQALAVLDQASAKIGITPTLQRHAIELELRRNQPEWAIERQRALEPLLGDSPDWKVEMGELLLQTGKKAEAERHFRLALDQLRALRPTPARQALLRRVQGHLGVTAPGLKEVGKG